MAICGLQQKKAALGGLLHNYLPCVMVSRRCSLLGSQWDRAGNRPRSRRPRKRRIFKQIKTARRRSVPRGGKSPCLGRVMAYSSARAANGLRGQYRSLNQAI
jgi:hypothetical protein